MISDCFVFRFGTHLWKFTYQYCWAFRTNFFYSFFTQRSVLFCFLFGYTFVKGVISVFVVSVAFRQLHLKWKIKCSHLITFVIISKDLIITSVEHSHKLLFLNAADDNFYLQSNGEMASQWYNCLQMRHLHTQLGYSVISATCIIQFPALYEKSAYKKFALEEEPKNKHAITNFVWIQEVSWVLDKTSVWHRKSLRLCSVICFVKR